MSTLFLSTTGGHLAQLDGLAERISPTADAVWVTHANEQSTSMLAGRDVEYVPYVGVKSVAGVLRCLRSAHSLWRRRRLTRAVSTGSGIALGYLPYLAARGVECHYIESAARVTGPSVTGRLLRWAPGVRTYTQYPGWADKHWRYGGGPFDAFRAVPRDAQASGPVRVVVTVGTATEFPFRRLFVPLAGLLAPGGPLERSVGLPLEVLWQTGGADVGDLAIRARAFLPAAELTAALAEADIVLSHAGTGSALAALGAGRWPVLVSRRRRDGEAGDDHQHELATELVRRGLALHRDAESITVADLLTAMRTAVVRSATAPPFTLSVKNSGSDRR